MAAFGVAGYVLVCLYFVFGSAVTKIKLEQKQAEGIAEARGGHRASAASGAAASRGSRARASPSPASARAMPVEARIRRQLLQQVERHHRERGGQGVRKDDVHVDAPVSTRAPGDGGRRVAGGDGRGDRRPRVRGRGGFSGPGGSDRSIDRDARRVRRDHGGSWLGATTQGEARFEWLTNDVVNAVQITLAALVAVAMGAAVSLCG